MTFEEWYNSSDILHCHEHYEIAKAAYEAATKAALVSRVVLPSDKEVNDYCYPIVSEQPTLKDRDIANAKSMAIDWYRDSIKLLPLTAEQVDSLLPSDESLRAECEDHINSCKKRAAVKEETWFEQGFYQGAEHALVYIRESIKKRLENK